MLKLVARGFITMQISPFILLSFIGSLLLLVFTLGYLYYLYSKHKEFEEKKSTEYQTASKIIENAHNKSREIIENAVEKAKETLVSTEYLKQDILKDLEASLRQVAGITIKEFEAESAEFDMQYKALLDTIRVEHQRALQKAQTTSGEVDILKQKLMIDLNTSLQKMVEATIKNLENEAVEFDKEYKLLLTGTREQYVKKAEETLKLMEKIPEDELTSFRELLRQQTIEAQALVEKKIQKEFEEAKQEIEEYKTRKFSAISGEIDKMAVHILEDVLGKSLSHDDHKELVLKALAKAEKDGVFEKV